MKITDTIRYAGVNDHQIDLFEGQYKVPKKFWIIVKVFALATMVVSG